MRYSFLLFVVLAGACTASGSARYSADVTTPRLVYVSDDVQVIEDYNEPVFFSANMYWRYDNGVWYQSRYHTRGWVRVSSPPSQIVRIERPQTYVHYRASAQVRSDNGPTRQEEKREMKEEKREEKREMKEEQREVKQEAKETKQEAKDTKHEAKEAAKEARKEEKEERKDEKKNDKDDHKKGKK